MWPTYVALKMFAVGLQISIPQLFTPPRAEKINGRLAVTKTGGGVARGTQTNRHALLAHALA